MFKREFLVLAASTAAAAALAGCSTTTPQTTDPAARRRTINAKADEALSRLYQQAPSARELIGKSKGVLIFPSVLSAGFVVGGSYGEGVLRKGGASSGYYSTAAGSVGLLAGAESKAIFLLFMTQESLDKFEASKGWTAGVDASVTVINVGANAGVDTKTAQPPIISFVVVGGGLMANISFDGTKFTKIDL